MTDREKLVELLDYIRYSQEFSCYDLYDMSDAAEPIADFLISKGVTVQRWIPVSERLPNSGEYVLCKYKDEENKEWETVGMILDDEWELDIDELGDRCLTVTHWMPIPPKED